MKTALPPTFSGPLCLGKKAVVFDIDGTLADSVSSNVTSCWLERMLCGFGD